MTMMPSEVTTAQEEKSLLADEVQVVEHLRGLGIPAVASGRWSLALARRPAGECTGLQLPRQGPNRLGCARGVEQTDMVLRRGRSGRGDVCVHDC